MRPRIEHAVAIIERLSSARRQSLRTYVLGLRESLRWDEQARRQQARAERSAEQRVRIVGQAQARADEAGDVDKLLALLDAIGGAS